MTAGRPAGLRYYDDYTGLRAPGEQARQAAYAEIFNNRNAEFFGGGAQTLLARYDRDWRSPRFHCEHSRISELQEESPNMIKDAAYQLHRPRRRQWGCLHQHYTARRRSLHCTTAVTTLHDAALRRAARTSTGPIRGGGRLRHQLVWRGFIHPLHRGPTRLHEYVGVHVVGLNLAVDRMHAWVQWWNNSSAHSNAEHNLWLPIRARLVPTRRTSRVNMDKMDKVTGMRQHVGTATR